VGELGVDTAVEAPGDGRYRATLSNHWEIWGPMGGYMATIALRAAGAETPFTRPSSFTCHYLRVARFGEVDIEVSTIRAGRSVSSLRVAVSQDGKQVMEALVAAAAAHGLLGWHRRLWSSTGQLVASGGGQGLFRPVPAPG
jgi:acyl-CoA thioesterase